MLVVLAFVALAAVLARRPPSAMVRSSTPLSGDPSLGERPVQTLLPGLSASLPGKT
jgi:hypothetical protein